MENEDLFMQIIYMLFKPADIVLHFFIFFAQSALFTLTVSMAIITAGKILTIMERSFYKYIKWFLYLWFIGYGVYTFGLYGDMLDMDLLDWSTIMFSIVAPICLLIVGKQISNLEYKGHKPFKIYYIIMLLYLLLAIVWFVFFPQEVMFGWLFIYWIMLVFLATITGYIKGV